MLEPDGGGEGFLTAESRGRHPLHLLANFNFDQTSPGHLSGEFGTDSQLNSPYSEEDQDPAILTNACFDKKHGHGHGHGGRPPLNLPTCAGTCSIGSGAHRTFPVRLSDAASAVTGGGVDPAPPP